MRGFDRVARTSVIYAVATVGFQVLLGAAAMGAAGLLAGAVLGAAIAATQLGIVVWRANADIMRRVTWAGARRAVRRFRRYAALRTPSVFLNTLGLWAPFLVIAAAFGPDVGGQFALAERVVALPVTLVAAAVGQVYYAEAGPLARDDPAALRALFVRATIALALVATVPAILVVVGGPIVIPILFGEAWAQAGAFMALLAPWYYLTLVANPTGMTLDLVQRPDLNLVRESTRLAAIGIASVVILAAGLEPIAAVVVMSVAGCITYLTYAFLTWRAIAGHRGGPPDASDPVGS
jgi:O-antigen/teichoic acid export membrane protein